MHVLTRLLVAALVTLSACNPFKSHPAYPTSNAALNEAQSGCFVVDQWITGIRALTAAATVVTGASGIATLASDRGENETAGMADSGSSDDEDRRKKLAITSIIFAGVAAATQIISSGMESRYEKKDCPAILRDASRLRTAELGTADPLPAKASFKGYTDGGVKKFLRPQCTQYADQAATVFYRSEIEARADGAVPGVCTTPDD